MRYRRIDSVMDVSIGFTPFATIVFQIMEGLTMKNLLGQIVIVMLGMMLETNFAQAGSFTFHYTDTTGNNAVGAFRTVNLTDSPYTELELATEGAMILTGTGNASAYNGDYRLVPGGPGNTQYPSYYYDNLVFPAGNSSASNDPNSTSVVGLGYIDKNGILFSMGSGSNEIYVNLYFAGPYRLAIADANGNSLIDDNQTGSLTLTAVPEPSSFCAAVIGLASLTVCYGYRLRKFLAI